MANQGDKNKPIEKENGDNTQWRPSDEPHIEPSENPTGAGGTSPAQQSGDPGSTPGKAEGEDFDEQ